MVTETGGTASFRIGGAGTFGTVSVTVLMGSTTVVETETAGGGVAAGGGAVAGGSFGAGAGSFGVAGSATGSALLEAEVDVAGVDEGACVVDAAPLDGVCVVDAFEVVPPAAGGLAEEVEPDELDEAFGADAGSALWFDALAELAGTTAAAWPAVAARRCACAFAFAFARAGAGVARDCAPTPG
jgi:hypothetical protein